MEEGEIYSCENFTIFAKRESVQEADFEYDKKSAVVYDMIAHTFIVGEFGLRFMGQKMYKAEIIENLRQKNSVNQIWDPELCKKDNEYSKFLIEDKSVIDACSELINDEYTAKLIERINHNTEFLDELYGLKENLDPQDPNFAESFLTLETAITEISDKVKKLRNLLEYGEGDGGSP